MKPSSSTTTNNLLLLALAASDAETHRDSTTQTDSGIEHYCAGCHARLIGEDSHSMMTAPVTQSLLVDEHSYSSMTASKINGLKRFEEQNQCQNAAFPTWSLPKLTIDQDVFEEVVQSSDWIDENMSLDESTSSSKPAIHAILLDDVMATISGNTTHEHHSITYQVNDEDFDNLLEYLISSEVELKQNADKNGDRMKESMPAIKDAGMSESKCEWESCTTTATMSIENLDHHLVEEHVVKSPYSYICKWKKCDRALKPFKKRYQLIRHLRIHSCVRPFICEQCKNSYSTRERLLIHNRTHTDSRPYECQIANCEKRFRSTGERTKHMHTRHRSDDVRYSCDVCDKVYKTRDALTKHVKMNHSKT